MAMNETRREGFMNGWADASLGLRLIAALTSEDAEYAAGYREGGDRYVEHQAAVQRAAAAKRVA